MRKESGNLSWHHGRVLHRIPSVLEVIDDGFCKSVKRTRIINVC